MTQQLQSLARLHLIALLAHDTSMHVCCYVHGLGLSIFSLNAPDPALTPYMRCTTLGLPVYGSTSECTTYSLNRSHPHLIP